jgi:drug/metabolite transporter (DMT)-like permease
MTPLATLLWAANLIVDTVGHLAFKAAANRTGDLEGFAHWRALAKGPMMWIGIACFVLESWLWLALLSFVPLSQGVLIGSVNIIGVMIGGRLLFAEKITLARFCGIGLVAIGVALAGWGA